MHLIVRQNNDLCELSGYTFPSLAHAANSASKELGVSTRLKTAVVRVKSNDSSVDLECWIVAPADGSTGLCREGQMTLIAVPENAIRIAIALCRRCKDHGNGEVVYK
jgi:hypothetical protein